MKKTVLIASANDFANNANVVHFTTLLAPPMGILAVGSYLADHDVPVELIDVQMDIGIGLTRQAETVISERVARYLSTHANEIAWVGISQLSNSDTGTALAQAIRAALPDIPIVFGGYFPACNYAAWLEQHPFVTAIVRGDGEAAALEISRSLAEGRSFLSDQTPNLAWLEDGEIRTTPVRPASLDDLPPLDFGLLRNPANYQLIDMMTSRGCPFQCNYCMESHMRPYADYSPEWVDRQLANLRATVPNESVYIYDPTFGVGRARTLAVCDVLSRHPFSYAVGSRVDVLTADVIPAMRRAGIEVIYFGVESASVETLLRMRKVASAAAADAYVGKALDVLRACFEHDMTIIASFMLAFPGDTEADYQDSLDFVRNVRQVYDESARHGAQAGFIPFAVYTKVYEGSTLAEQIETEFPDTVLKSGLFVGEMNVYSPSPGVELDTTERYQADIARLGAYTPVALERFRRFGAFSLQAFLAAHSEILAEGVATLRDELVRHPHEFGVESMLLQYDKSKDH